MAYRVLGPEGVARRSPEKVLTFDLFGQNTPAVTDDDTPVAVADGIVPPLGGYDAKIITNKKCATELAFSNMPEFADQVLAPSQFTETLFAEGNRFEDSLVGQFMAIGPKATQISCLTSDTRKGIRAATSAATQSGATVIELVGENDRDDVEAGRITMAEGSRAKRAFATEILLAAPNNVKVITNPRLAVTPDMTRIGEPDFLMRSETNQPNGRPAWLGVDAKMHRAIDTAKRHQMDYVTFADMAAGHNVSGTLPTTGRAPIEDAIQLVHYRDMLAAHGFGNPKEEFGYIIGKAVAGLGLIAVRMDLNAKAYKNNKTSAVELYKDGFTQAVQVVANARSAGVFPKPRKNALCPECPFRDTCRKIWEDTDEVSVLQGVTATALPVLEELEIHTIADLASMPLDTPGIKNDWIDVARVYDSARKSGKSYAYRKRGLETFRVDLRPAALFVDMENSVAMADTLLDPSAEMIVYQWGVHSMNYELDSESKVTGQRYNDAAGQAATHIQFDSFEHTGEAERKVFADFWAYVQKARRAAIKTYGSADKFGVYAWSDAEKHMFKHLTSKHADAPGIPTMDEMDAFIEAHVIDQLKVCQQLVFPVESYSIKDIAKMILDRDGNHFEWPMEDAGGAASTIWYYKACEGDQDMVTKVRAYNKADTEIQVQIQNQFIRVARSLKDSGWKQIERLDRFYTQNPDSFAELEEEMSD